MAVPLLALLPASARAAYPIIVGGVRRGLSTREIEGLVRGAGFPISRSRSIVPLRRAIIAADQLGSNVRFIPKALSINTNRLPESITPIRRQFSYIVRLSGVDSVGNEILRRVTVSTDRRTLTPGEIEDIATDLVSLEGQSDTLFDAQATLEFGMRNALPP